jgi:hypothetical protein
MKFRGMWTYLECVRNYKLYENKMSIQKPLLLTSLIMAALMLPGCATNHPGKIGLETARTYVILGQNKNSEKAQYYANKYQATVLYAKSVGVLADATANLITSVAGPSSVMKNIINEFRTINGTDGQWQFIIPKETQHYLAVTLRNMKENEVVDARGAFYLPESVGPDHDVENEVNRVFGGKFKVVYKSNS